MARKRLAVSLGIGHAEVAPHPLLGRAALAVADDQNLFAAQPRHSAGHCLIVAKGAIPMNLTEISEDPLYEIHRVGPLGIPGQLDSDPRRRTLPAFDWNSLLPVRSWVPGSAQD